MKKEISKNAAEEKNIMTSPYAQLSEEEMQQEIQELLKKRKEYQKEIEEEVRAIRKEKAEERRRRLSSVAKVAVLVFVAGTCLFAFSLRSEANRMWWLARVERIIGSEAGHVVDNDENRVLSGTQEQQAIAEIMDRVGVPMPGLYYKPKELIFDGYDYDETMGRGSMYYQYEGHIVTLKAYTAGEDTSYARNYDGDILEEEIINTGYASVIIREIKAAGDESPSLIAEWTYHNHQYQITGKLPFEELKQIIENIFY